ncbi:MAG TPA: OST-HTH/LOTUS domain-containing protein [Burkholderiaceae bacterium]|nr:OST-HTH/LOTUS domain-containing protein [Burkholderiaceae bacterium]
MSPDRTPASDEVLRRVGRNLVTFQLIESFLKFLVANSKFSQIVEYEDGSPREKSDEGNSTARSMLGELVKKYVADVLVDAGAELPESELPIKAVCRAGFTFRVECERDALESLRVDLKRMTEARNELVHHFLPRWKPEDEDAMNEAMAYLDAQREMVLPMFDHLRATALGLQQSRQWMADYFASPESARDMELMLLQGSSLVRLLCDIAGQVQRADGWTYVATAGQVAAREMPDNLRDLKARYGFSTLKKLLIGSELFEVMDEPLENGGFRALYRLKARQ